MVKPIRTFTVTPSLPPELERQRAPVLKAYLKRAPGARPHPPIDNDAPLSEFERVSAQLRNQ